MKLELCKFYLMDCCAKGENCSYMHSEFPCKFYHTGLACSEGKDCKFAHGQPLSEGNYILLFFIPGLSIPADLSRYEIQKIILPVDVFLYLKEVHFQYTRCVISSTVPIYVEPGLLIVVVR